MGDIYHSVNKRKQGWDEPVRYINNDEQAFSAQDIAEGLGAPLVSQDVVRRALIPQLRSAQRIQGFIQFKALVAALSSVLCDACGKVTTLLHQCLIDEFILGCDLRHENPDQAAILCGYMCVDPWNASNAAAACQVGNLNQAPPSLHHALRWHRSKVWDMEHAVNAACSVADATHLMVNFESHPVHHRYKIRRNC